MRTRGVLIAVVLGMVPAWSSAQTSADLFEPTAIRDLHVTISERDWALLRENFQLNTYYPCDVRIVMSGQEAVVRNVGVRSRGSGSRSGVKPALKFDISRYVSGQRFLGVRAIILRNLLQDASMLREHVTLELHRRLGLAVPRTVFARLFVNQVFSGLYEIIEDVDQEFLDRVVGEHEGYLYELNWLSPYYFQYLGPDLLEYQRLWSAQTHSNEPVATLYGPFEELTRTTDRSRPEDFAMSVGRHLDLHQVLRLAAADNFMADWDGIVGAAGANNIYLYRPLAGPAFVVPWDKDNAFHALDYDVFAGTRENAVTSRALRDPRLRGVYVDALRAAARLSREPTNVQADPVGGVAAGTVGWLEAFIDATAALIRKSAWTDQLKAFTKEQFEAAVLEARVFARRRADIVDAQLSGE